MKIAVVQCQWKTKTVFCDLKHIQVGVSWPNIGYLHVNSQIPFGRCSCKSNKIWVGRSLVQNFVAAKTSLCGISVKIYLPLVIFSHNISYVWYLLVDCAFALHGRDVTWAQKIKDPQGEGNLSKDQLSISPWQLFLVAAFNWLPTFLMSHWTILVAGFDWSLKSVN